ncbi:semaphorin-4A isoform X2 [Spea bombifrons]|uniref:semaphorin-4A isoform X2 n=1 Tax=Spea bombifrons TaxID=233779 RepID=UPI00234B5BE5|nr:semaphorin-4A isoform X2 [Spea bombifrons]
MMFGSVISVTCSAPCLCSAGRAACFGSCKCGLLTMATWLVGLWLVLAGLSCVPAEQVPRITFQRGDPTRPVSTFSLENVRNYNQFHLSNDQEKLYVGARDNVLSFSIKESGSIQLLKQILWPSSPAHIFNCVQKAKSNETDCFNFIRILLPVNDTHLYTCGTNSFSPICSYIDLETFSFVTNIKGEIVTVDGKGQSPFDPQHKHTAVVVDGELYTGTTNNFQGNEPIIFRNLGSRTYLKTDASLGWLHSDASFVGSFNLPGHAVDSKVYFFFEETAREFDFFEKLTVSRVARVCKNDVGGDKVLQKKWTTFLKAQLICSHPDGFPFNVLHHVAVLRPDDPELSTFFGVFSAQWQVGGSSSSAVCSYRLKDIERVFNGNYKEQNKESSRWTTYTGIVSNPRPGSCISGKFSDTDLNFMKDHFLMDEKVSPPGRVPLLIKQSVQYTQIAIDSVQGISRHNYTVMFLGTDKGFLHKVVLVNGRESHIIEELEVLANQEPVQSLLLVPGKRVLYIGYSSGIAQVPLANCSVYTSCFDCILARDPYCAWDGESHKCRGVQNKPSTNELWLQDVESGNPNSTCLSPEPKGRASRPTQDSDTKLVRVASYTVSYNTILKLHCPQLSALATYSWRHPMLKPSNKQMIASKDTLVIIVKSDTLGLYECWASENGFTYLVAKYWVKDPSGVDVRHKNSPNTDDSNKALQDNDVEMSPSSDNRSYYTQFVVVTVLLVSTICVILGFALYGWRDKLKAKTKIQGCSTPETEKLSAAKAQGNPGQNGVYQSDRDVAKVCCVPLSGADGKMDLDNNSVKLRSSHGGAEDASDV